MRKSGFIVVAVLGLLVGKAETQAKPVEFDFADPKGVNTITFVLDSVLEPIMGLASGISGTVSYDPAKPETTTGTIIVTTASLHTENPGMKKTIQGADWLDAATYPEISLTVKTVKDVKRLGKEGTQMTVAGAFTCKGITKEITVPVIATFLQGKAGDRIRGAEGDLLVLRSKFSIKRSDFGIKKGMGSEVVAEEIELRVSIVGLSKKQ